MEIRPINGHLIIEPRKQETFLPTERGTFQEIGVVKSRPWYMAFRVNIGDEIYFDSWLSSKYPTGENDEEFYLVPWKDVRAIKRHEKNEVPK